jgi:hypothetical protein
MRKKRVFLKPILILGVCILLRVWDQGAGVFPSTQRYYHRLFTIYFYLTATLVE